MKLTKGKKIILTVIIMTFIILLFNGSIINAEVNIEYEGGGSIRDDTLDEAVGGSILLELLARLVFAVGQLIEWLMGIIFQLLTGNPNFPWADKIVFNAVPILDVNFINPGSADIAKLTFVGQIGIQGVLKNIYATLLALSVSFFGIAVMITSIKLVLSTIASEKAKYKQACIDWVVGFVMLFCIHYFISFIFYLNEQLVIVASKFATAAYEQQGEELSVQMEEIVTKEINEAREKGYKYNGPGPNNGKLVADIMQDNYEVVRAWVSIEAGEDTYGIKNLLTKEYEEFKVYESSKGDTVGDIKYGQGEFAAISKDKYYQNLAMAISWATDPDTIQYKKIKDIYKNYIFRLSVNWVTSTVQAVEEWRMKEIFGKYYDYIYNRFLLVQQDSDGNAYIHAYAPPNALGFHGSSSAYDGVEESTTTTKATREALEKEIYTNKNTVRFWQSAGGAEIAPSWYQVGAFDMRDNVRLNHMLTEFGTLRAYGENYGENGNLKRYFKISDLASFFKFHSFEREYTEENLGSLTKTGNIVIQNMIMYTVLVIQSIILFIAYVKRLFYVLLVALMAPVVVVFDFFKKFGK